MKKQIGGPATAPLLILLTLTLARPAPADIFTQLASYETTETDLVVTANAGDPGLALSIVPGGVNGAPPATHGDRVLRVQIANETDRKVEFRHDWWQSTYDLAGRAELLADVYVASSGALPGLIGVWSANWDPPDAWQPATHLPAGVGAWQTVRFNLQDRTQTGLAYLHAFVLEDLAGTGGTLYLDNLRFRAPGGVPTPSGVAALGYEHHNEVHWSPISTPNLAGYNVYGADLIDGPYVRLNAAPVTAPPYRAAPGPRHYAVTSVVGSEESTPSPTAFAMYNGLSDDALMDVVQQASLGYFWNAGHWWCGLAREGIGFGHPSDTVTTGGTGFGLATIVVGAERGFIPRAAAAERVRRILRFLDGRNPQDPNFPSNVQRYHGAWAHHYNGVTGATIAFAGPADNGGDLVETAFLVQGFLVVRQYFDNPADPVETEIRARATSLWETVEWNWYRRFPGGNVLYWHWSPDHAWEMNLPIRGWNETAIIYLLAIASPTFPMPAASWYQGFCNSGAGYANPNTYYGYRQWVGEPLGGPLFFTHYSYLGWDPRFLRDAYTNYFENSRNIARIHRAHSIANPNHFADYGPLVWGLTASANPWGYLAHSPTVDNGTITPTAALSAMPYTPAESLATLRHFYDAYGDRIWGAYGFYDAFNPSQNWVGTGYLAIDQGPIAPMIENYRTELVWRLFMANPEIKSALRSIGFRYEVDFNSDGDVDWPDATIFLAALAGPDVATVPPGVTAPQFDRADLDNDGDVDLRDATVTQRLFTGP